MGRGGWEENHEKGTMSNPSGQAPRDITGECRLHERKLKGEAKELVCGEELVSRRCW